jgi:CTP synthase (UTP-ammonia lyase)
LEASGLRFTALGEHGEVRAAELPRHRFFLATLFLPQHRSTPDQPHPLVVAYLRAALGLRD